MWALASFRNGFRVLVGLGFRPLFLGDSASGYLHLWCTLSRLALKSLRLLGAFLVTTASSAGSILTGDKSLNSIILLGNTEC